MKKGSKMSPESKMKMRLAKLGKPRAGNPEKWKHSEESKEKNRVAHIGRKPNEKQLECLSLGRGWNRGKTGFKHTDEVRAIIIKNLRQGRGAESPAWRGGITPINKAIRGNLESRNWRLRVFERDGFICQMPNCSKTERYLQAHHIKTFSKYPELRTTLDNGITLCRKCHYTTIGKEEQFEEMFKAIVTVTAGEKLYMAAGTPASTPTSLSCTLGMTETF